MRVNTAIGRNYKREEYIYVVLATSEFKRSAWYHNIPTTNVDLKIISLSTIYSKIIRVIYV